ncbi:acyl-CoA dehydrogenase family protein [Temperatibacter marinus]|uniref:Dibenzothiophene monooxygenase n=1 Tax=Temperatibacter marinus TaxID=1456591 RepID=A0AA52H9T6_9PROT|nr:acyl-CoA dehydrogenase family protein [Temperatibacter marinus]WND03531.1 acyl-CoA dehydrogenase family protein [Temperatibacter marinus]
MTERADTKYTGEFFVEGMTDAEKQRAAAVDSVLPALKAAAAEVDREGAFHRPHVKTLSDAGLMGLIVPKSHGGMGGGLRDLAAATYALGTACPSTALAFFFHCSSASRGLLALEALENGFFDASEKEAVQAFADKVLNTMGHEKKWLANFASESVKSEKAAITISTKAKKIDGGYLLNGVKSFGCATGVADQYLVTASLEGNDTGAGLCTFFIDPKATGVSERQKWDAIGMRGTATHGIILEDVIVSDENALAIPGAFVKCMQMSRGSFVGNQLAGIAVYLGAGKAIYDASLHNLKTFTFGDTGKPIGHAPFQQELIGKMMVELETATIWLRRQLELEAAEVPLLPKHEVVQRWRLCKGVVAESAFKLATYALKTSGTSGTGFSAPMARGLRDMAMALVQAFPIERGRLMAAQMEMDGAEQSQFGVSKK